MESIVMEGDKTGIPPNIQTTQEHFSKEIFAITNLRIFFYSINIKDVMGFEPWWIFSLDHLKYFPHSFQWEYTPSKINQEGLVEKVYINMGIYKFIQFYG